MPRVKSVKQRNTPISRSKIPLIKALPPHPPLPKKITVLSLFDGVSTGFYALNELNFDIQAYYASEIDVKAIKVSSHHFGNNINQLGCVKTINEDTIKSIGKIDLLIGGSPCVDLSCVNSRRKNMFDINGTALLFFEFYRIKTILDKSQRQFFWLFENVAHMELTNKNIISKFLGCQPIMIDSYYVSPQTRRRFFWTNMPGVTESIANNIGEGPTLDSCLDNNLGRQANVKKTRTITTKRSCLQDSSSKDPVTENGTVTGLYITEIEKIFGFPPHFTDVGNLSTGERQKLLGRAWSVPVVKKIFQTIKNNFATKQP